ncbi:YybH family protein [Phenylobacterium hankyongense]|nr:nuclear transport factor 2 family protein [Phenylobacterium hankyongense]
MSEILERNAASEVSEAVRAAIEEADAAFMEAFNRGDAGAAARGVYTRDAQIQPPGAPLIEGREAIAEFWAGGRQELGIKTAQLATVKLRPAGPYVHQLGAFTLTFADGAQATGKYAVLWKEEDGQLKWHVDTWNMDA